jgi:rod shape-determining protein MreB
VLNEPSVVAYSACDNTVVGLRLRRPANARACARARCRDPTHAPRVIADYLVTEGMLRYFIGKAVGKYSLFRPVVMMCIPAGVANLESRAVLVATIQTGAMKLT